MLNNVNIYTCGKMSGISFNEQMEWRKELETTVKSVLSYTGKRHPNFIHPPLFYNYEVEYHKTEREILDWEMMQLHNCDVVVINLSGINDTVGSHMELGAIQGINRFGDKYIFVLGIGDSDNLHPWIKESCNRIEKDVKSAANYIVDYLLV